MSSKGRGAESVESDWYATPPDTTRSILRELEPRLGRVDSIVEPTAGKGAIVAVAREFYPNAYITAIELDSARHLKLVEQGIADQTWRGDFADWQSSPKAYDVAILNPPFTIAISIIERALATAKHTIALVRLGLLASMERRLFWRQHPCDIYPLASRPSFAASLKCVIAEPGSKKKSGCGWAVIQELEAPRPKICPQCMRGQVSVTTSDSADYFWGHFWAGAREVRVL